MTDPRPTPHTAPADATRSKRFIGALLAFGLLWVIVLSSMVVWINPWSEFPSDTFEPLVPNQYAIKHDLWADDAWDTIVLGSSRAQNLVPDALQDQGFTRPFNHAVGGAEIVDALGQYRAMVAQDRAPSTLIVGLDTWQLRPNPSTSLRIANVDAIAPYVVDAPGPLDYAQVAVQSMISPTYYRDMAKSVALEIRGHPAPGFGFYADGGLVAATDAYRVGQGAEGNPDRVAHLLPKAIDDHLGVQRRDATTATHLATLIDEALDHGDVLVYLTPMHPDLRTALAGSGHDAMVQDTLDALTSDCPVGLGVYDMRTTPTVIAGEFDDPTHVTGHTATSIAHALADPAFDLCQAATP